MEADAPSPTTAAGDLNKAFVDYELESNPFLKALYSYKETVSALSGLDILVLLPQSVSLQDTVITEHMVNCHVVLLDPQNQARCIGLDGTRGLIKEFGDGTSVVSMSIAAPVDAEWKLLCEYPSMLFRQEIQVLLEKFADTTSESAPIIFQKSNLTLSSLNQICTVAFISAPLNYSLEPRTGSTFTAKDVISLYQKYTRPPTEVAPATTHHGYRHFIEKLRSKIQSKDPIKIALRRFTDEFANTHTDGDGARVAQFVNDILQLFINHPDWGDNGPEDINSTIEGIERLVMTKIYDRVFPPNGRADEARDKSFQSQCRKLSFLEMKHLEIPEIYEKEHESLTLARTELLSVDKFKAPRDKLICLLNCCKIIAKIIFKSSGIANADEFLPLLIWVVLTAAPPQLSSNLEFISRYRNPSKLMSETAYYFTNFELAMTFIENLTSKQVNMDASEFERLYKGIGSPLPTSPGGSFSSVSAPSANTATPPKHALESKASPETKDTDQVNQRPSDLLEMQLEDLTSARHSEQDVLQSSELQRMSALFAQNPSGAWLPRQYAPVNDALNLMSLATSFENEPIISAYRFENTSIHSLKMGDIPALLEEYKLLIAENRRLHTRLATIRHQTQTTENES